MSRDVWEDADALLQGVLEAFVLPGFSSTKQSGGRAWGVLRSVSFSEVLFEALGKIECSAS